MTKRIDTQLWPVADLIPYAKNAKKHSAEQVATLAGLIEKQGWTQPIVILGEDIDDQPRGTIVVGHGRRLAAIKLGRKNVPVAVLYGYTRAEIDAMRLSDNRVASSDYDIDMLQEELARLALDEDLDLTELGFSAKEMEFLTGDLGEIDDSVFADDITAAVEKQTEDNKEAISETDDHATPVVEALGFKRVTIAQSRAIRAFIARLEGDTGKKGAAALIDFIESGAWR